MWYDVPNGSYRADAFTMAKSMLPILNLREMKK
jgi:hypothetical protein